jgi:deoxyribonuclease V
MIVTLGDDNVRPSSPEQARELQEQLARRVRREPPGTAIRWIAGEDCCYSTDDSLCGAAVVVWDLETREEVETGTVLSEVPLPYIPGLLAFREAPAILKVLERLTPRPQVLICDGHGIAHPRSFGLACHVRLMSGNPRDRLRETAALGDLRRPGHQSGIEFIPPRSWRDHRDGASHPERSEAGICKRGASDRSACS